ncbi:YbdD/YjiX family protein [Actinomyces bowdenii]|uniref:YbdD/YjiX family protein n=1 Tax=Actinomyces bowdenii TaxID=131109 RepID=A0A3P1V7G9_9ACTO|nr:YbdD/YjiX family protein [Actinomyces bowdenii]MBO3724135.1 YbdD/YjiX family protein [Actinomyces bowdenii]RRD30144.1 YbdD/YjiX family protein [Actinomyces bowdenii]
MGAGRSGGGARRAPAPFPPPALTRSLHRARALWRDMTGESAYERYLARHAREHPDHEPMSAREFWRARDRLAETSVSTGCC